MQQPQQQPPGMVDNAKAAGAWMYVIAHAMGTTMEASFLRTRFGSRYLGTNAALGLATIFFFILCWPHDDPRPLLYFLVWYVGMCAFHRIHGIARARRGDVEHSLYSGTPRLLRFFPCFGELTVKRFIDPAVVLFAGWVTTHFSEPLGCYFILSAVGMFLQASVAQAFTRVLTQNSIDSMIEARQHAERVRSQWPHRT